MSYNYSSTAGEYTLTADITSSATSVPLDSVVGLPAAPFKVVIEPGTNNEEILKVTVVAGTTLTVERGHDSSVAVAHSALASVRHMMTAEDLRLSRQHEAATADVHGATGNLVGTSGTQALTNKDLSDPTNTFPASLATSAALTAHTGATAAHGIAGAVVGTTDTQTLTNKTLNAPLVTGDLAVSSGILYVGSSASTTERSLRVDRLGTDAVARQVRLAVNGANGISLILYKGAANVNNLQLNDDGSSQFSGALSAPSATVGGVTVTTASNTQALTNKDLSSATNTFPTNLTASKFVASNGASGKRMAWGSITTATFASGDYTVTHSLGWTPSQVFLNADVSASVFTLGMKAGAAITSTQFVARAVVWDTGTVGPELYSGPVGNLRWFAIE